MMRDSGASAAGSASERAYEFAKWAILNAVYPGGAQLTEQALSRETGVGGAAVREALARLEAEGLVEHLPARGPVVATFSVRDVEDVLEVRVLVENHTAGRSFARRADLLPTVEAVHARLCARRREQDTAGFTACDRLFHEAIVEAAGNGVLASVYRMLRERQALFTSAMMRGRADRMDATIVEHEQILDALRGDDEQVFCDAVNAHLRWSAALAQESP